MKRASLLLAVSVIFLHGCGHAMQQTRTTGDTTADNSVPSTALPVQPVQPGKPVQPVATANPVDRQANEELRKNLLADPSLSVEARNIIVTTIAGRMTLSGAVQNQLERAKIVATAAHLAGVISVQDQLEPLDRSLATGNQAIQ